MAIARMKKVYIFSHERNREAILEKLHSMGVLEITDAKEALKLRKEESSGREEVGWELARISKDISFLSKFEVSTKTLIDEFFPEKIEVTSKEFEKAESIDLLAKIEKLEKELGETEKHEKRLEIGLKEIEPWENLNLNFEEMKDREKVCIRACSAKTKIFGSFLEKFSSLKPSPSVLEGREIKNEKYFILIFSISALGEAEKLMGNFGVKFYFLSYSGKPKENIDRIKNEIEKANLQKAGITKSIAELSKHKKELLMLYDILLIEKEKRDILSILAKTEKAMVIAGWCPEKHLEILDSEVKKISTATEILSREPAKNEKAPVILENKLAQPFEAVTNIYGTPSYSELDPTPFLAPFFFIFFGFALTDAGYGTVLSLLSIYFWKKIQNRGAKRIFKLLFLGGVSTLFLGAATGGWFGNSFAKFGFPALENISKRIMLFDPIEDPVLMLLIALILGFVHVFFGTALNMYKSVLKNKKKEALSQGAFLIMLLSIALILIGGSAGEFGKAAFLASLLILIFGRGFLGSFAALYSLLGYFGDVLSYSRLLALGLATGVIAIVVNEIASMAFSIPYIGVIIGLAVFLVGHSFNLVINTLGAFIHSSRLQFVEFFTKFFEGGGKIFKPFRIETKYTTLKDKKEV